MKTIDEQVKEIKDCAECAIYYMDNHKLPWLKDDGSFEDTINSMHNAQNKDKLGDAYYKYINLCIMHGYSDGDIIAGIMQNDAKNNEFNVNIDSVIKSLIEIKYTTVKLSDPVIKKPEVSQPKAEEKSTSKNDVPKAEEKPTDADNDKKADDNTAGGIKISDKIIKKIEGKLKYISGITNKVVNNQSEDIANDINKIKSVSAEAKQMITSIDPTSCSKEEIAELNDASAAIDNSLKMLDNALKISTAQSNTVQQPAAAHTEGGFNIANFVKQNQQPVSGPKVPVDNKHQQKPTAFPHQICGLTDDQIVAEVNKHFKVIQELPAYALYDLINNKLLIRKMKELDAKQRPNNPYLTQVNINEYIDVPELLAQYPLCFTMPCNDKKQVIIVLFNPNPVLDKNGILNYPLHIFKATKTNNK